MRTEVKDHSNLEIYAPGALRPRVTAKAVVGIALICLAFWLTFLTCISGILSTQKRIRADFQLADYLGAVPQQVQSAILAIEPIGTTRDDVDRFLRSRGIGSDAASACVMEGTQLRCVVGSASHFWNFVGENYVILFGFDSKNRLQSVEVKTALVFRKRS